MGFDGAGILLCVFLGKEGGGGGCGFGGDLMVGLCVRAPLLCSACVGGCV